MIVFVTRERSADKTWDDWVREAYLERVPLFASGFYATPGIWKKLGYPRPLQLGRNLNCNRPRLRPQDQQRQVVRLRHLRRRLLRGRGRLPHRRPLRPEDGHRDGPGREPQPGHRHRTDRGGFRAGVHFCVLSNSSKEPF